MNGLLTTGGLHNQLLRDSNASTIIILIERLQLNAYLHVKFYESELYKNLFSCSRDN